MSPFRPFVVSVLHLVLLVVHVCLFLVVHVVGLHVVHVVVVHLFVSLEHCVGSVRKVHINQLSVLDNSWKHGHETAGGTDVEPEFRVQGWAFLRRYCSRESGTGTVFTREPRMEQKSRRGKVASSPVPDPQVGMFRSLKGVK